MVRARRQRMGYMDLQRNDVRRSEQIDEFPIQWLGRRSLQPNSISTLATYSNSRDPEIRQC
jgi:hypothetical protein